LWDNEVIGDELINIYADAVPRHAPNAKKKKKKEKDAKEFSKKYESDDVVNMIGGNGNPANTPRAWEEKNPVLELGVMGRNSPLPPLAPEEEPSEEPCEVGSSVMPEVSQKADVDEDSKANETLEGSGNEKILTYGIVAAVSEIFLRWLWISTYGLFLTIHMAGKDISI
jgi:hypothetical protein